MSKIAKISAAKIAYNNLVKGTNRHDFLGKKVKAFYDASSYNVFTVENTAVDTDLKAGVILHRKLEDGSDERVPGLIFKGGFAIVIQDVMKFDDGYETFLSEIEGKAEAFKPGLEIKLSPAVAMRVKSVVLAFQAKNEGLTAMLGKKKLFGSKDPKKKSAVFQCSNPSEMEDSEMEEQELVVRFDEKFMLTIVDMVEACGTEMFRIASGMAALLDLSGFKAKMKVLEDEANKREEELNK